MKLLFTLLFFLVCIHGGKAQDFSKAMHNAFLITRMVEKFHVQPKPLNDEFSSNLFTMFLNRVDESKTLFLAEDIAKLSAFRFQLDDAVLKKQTAFLELVATIYLQRMRQNDSLIRVICKPPFQFTVPDKLLTTDTGYAISVSDQQIKFSKYLKWQVLDDITDDEYFLGLQPAAQKKFLDSAEAVQRKAIVQRSSRKYAALASTQKINTQLSNIFCKALSNCYDPHTEFMPADEKEEHDEDLGQKPLRFGLGLDEDENGEVKINNLLPGSSAYKSGILNTGDKIIAIQEHGKPVMNVSDFNVQQLDSLLNETKSQSLQLTVKKPDGTTKQTTVYKERFAADEDEESKVQGYVLKGVKNIGYISIPDFYIDWEDAETGVAGCANDVAKEIIKLKQENIQALLIDIRYNGGGSLGEAIDLAGIFIDGGPVGQYKQKNAKAAALKDVNSGSIYDGPLMILVNGYSASASEMLSGTLQDYNRAVIAGTPTYGKATGQVIFPLDTLVTEETIQKIKTEDYLKITTFGLYRVNGTSAQQTGIMPDILLPDLLQIAGEKEKNEQFSLALTTIDANKYYKPLPVINKDNIKITAKNFTDSSAYFKMIREYELLYKQVKEQKMFSLKLEDVLQYKKKQQAFLDLFEKFSQQALFQVDNCRLQKERLATSEWLTVLDNETKAAIGKDLYIDLCYRMLLQMIK